MTLAMPFLCAVFELLEDTILDLVIESEEMYSRTLLDLQNLSNGDLGEIRIANRDKLLSINKDVDIIWNPIQLNVNDSRILKKLYQEIQKCAVDDISELYSINKQICEYLDKLLEKIPHGIEYSTDLSVAELCKVYNVSFLKDYDSVFDFVIEYIRIMHRMCGIEVFILIDIKKYFGKEVIQDLYSFLMYEKVYVVNISSSEKYNYEIENRIIVDKDQCIIEMD